MYLALSGTAPAGAAPPTSGVYRECLLAEMEQILLEEHPEMKAGDGVFASLRDRPAQEE